MFIVTGIVLLIGIFLVLIRAYLGPTVYDRILALNAMGTKTVVFVALLGWISKRPDFLDIALLYALMNYISTITILKFIEKKRLDC
ncbi:MAG TPA: cation:proton antiporter [Verrucomicrobiales bacterium]|nr:cation:proton antiporter [Verrucomicrobiales bacterium]HIL71301.1 cation:proton antiporter [Verrucomicrobiota bacterium]